MASTLIQNIRLLVNAREHAPLLRGKALADVPVSVDGFLIIDDQHITAYGEMKELLNYSALPADIVDASDRFVLPAWCDSHTHIVFAASREQEFIDKLRGLSYADIAARGGGILNSARLVHETAEE